MLLKENLVAKKRIINKKSPSLCLELYAKRREGVLYIRTLLTLRQAD